MKTTIIITGSGISSKLKILGAIDTTKAIIQKLPVNNYEVIFETKKQAIKALSTGYNLLKSDIQDWQNSLGSYKYGVSLSYDAGYAEIK